MTVTPLASAGATGGMLAGIEDAIDTVFTPVAEGLSAVVFAEIPLFGVSFPLDRRVADPRGPDLHRVLPGAAAAFRAARRSGEVVEMDPAERRATTRT